MTKDSIIITALRLFLLRGYKNVSLIDVAKEVGITKGGIYHYFGSKEALFHAGISYLFTRFEGKYAEFLGEERSCQQILHFMLCGEHEAYIESLLEIKQGDYRANHASLALEVMHNFPEVQERIDGGQLALCDMLTGKLQIAQSAGEIRQDLAAQDLAAIILSVSSGMNVLGKNINTPVIRQQVVGSLWQLIGISTPKE